mgnify:CR=1 FL=1
MRGGVLAGDNGAMPVVIERPTLASRFFFLWRGFDLPLLVAVGLLALLGLVTMYSSGFAHGELMVRYSYPVE